jgi:hypothetical protein
MARAKTTSSAHTAGPQYYVSECPETGRQFLVQSRKDGNIIELTLANVSVIAAAPSHNEAIRKMVAGIEDMLDDDNLRITSDCGDLLLQIATIGNEAIAKAEAR